MLAAEAPGRTITVMGHSVGQCADRMCWYHHGLGQGCEYAVNHDPDF
jgi:hypothetical protein